MVTVLTVLTFMAILGLLIGFTKNVIPFGIAPQRPVKLLSILKTLLQKDLFSYLYNIGSVPTEGSALVCTPFHFRDPILGKHQGGGSAKLEQCPNDLEPYPPPSSTKFVLELK